jgi:hypothetical protein
MRTIDKTPDPTFMLKQLMAIAEASGAQQSGAPEHSSRASISGQSTMHGLDASDLLVLAARRARGETYAAIAADLNRRGIRGGYGARWYSASVWTLLHRRGR